MSTICKNCGQELPENVKFCTNCGEPVIWESICPACGEKVKSGAKFCTSCGAPLDKSEAAAEPAQPSNPVEAPATAEPSPEAEPPAPVSVPVADPVPVPPPTKQNQSQPTPPKDVALIWAYKKGRSIYKENVTVKLKSFHVKRECPFETECVDEEIPYTEIRLAEISPKSSVGILVLFGFEFFIFLALCIGLFSSGSTSSGLILLFVGFPIALLITFWLFRFDFRHQRLTLTKRDGSKIILEANTKDMQALTIIKEQIESMNQ